MTLEVYYPEMQQARPVADIEARMSYDGKHYYLYTQLELSGRGIEFIKTYQKHDLVPNSHRVGMTEYKVTRRVFEQVRKQYRVSFEALLD